MRLIRGAPGSGKTRQVFREFKAAMQAGETNLRIVVPTATLVRHFQHELARDGVVISPRSVVSLNRFLAECAGEVKLAPDGLLRAIVRDSLRQLSFPQFVDVSGTEGMAELVVETINLFENAGCTPEKLASVKKLGAHAKPFEKLWRAVAERVRQCGYELRGNWIRAAAVNGQSGRVWMDGFLNFSPAEKEFLSALARTCDVAVTIADLPATSEIHRFALTLGAQDQLLPGSPRRPGTIAISAATIEREADEIARRIIELHKQGTDFRDIGVALRDAPTYSPLLQGTFARFGIPARFYFPTPLLRHPAAIFLSGLLSAALSGWNFETTINALRAHPRWGWRADFDRFDFTVREAMPGNGAAELLKLCESDWLREEIVGCLGIEAWTLTSRKPAEWAERLQSFASNLYRPGLLDAPRDHSAVEAARSHVAGLRAWLGAIDSVATFWTNGQPISLADFWSVATVAVDACALHAIDDRAGVVHVMDAWEARQWDVATLVVCGMTDQDFPRKRAQHLLFPDSDIEILRKAGVPLRKSADYEREEEWLFDSLRTRAADSLILTRAEHDAAGKSVQPSRFIDSDQPVEPAQLCRPSPRIAAPAPASSGIIVPPNLHTELARLHQSISVSSLEDLAQCRFRFFSRRTLLLESAPERPDERINPRISGSILHTAMERWLTDRSQNFVAVFEAAFDETCAQEHLPAGYRLEVQRIELRKIAEHISATDRWQPDAPPEVEVPLTLEFPNGIQVTCRIDRLDRFGNDCVIIDYKSGKTARVEKFVTSPSKLQGPLYALAVREQRNLNPVAVIFWGVREDKLHGWGAIPHSDIPLLPIPQNWMADAKARTVERITSFLGGQVRAHPEDAGDCIWCDYRDACRVEQGALVRIGGAFEAA